MKNVIVFGNDFYRLLFLVFICTLLWSCSQQTKDKDIKQMLVTKAKEEIAFAAVNYSIDKGVVALTGTCATDKERQQVEQEVKQTPGVKQVVNNILVAPVILDGEHLLKQ